MSLALGLLFLFLVTFAGSGPVPTPVMPTVFWLGQFNQPVLVVGVALLGTLTGWTTIHFLLRRFVLSRSDWERKIPVSYRRFFLRYTGWSVFLCNAVPFPWEPVRFLALASGYPFGRLLLALALGRLIRYTLLVFVGSVLAPYKIAFWGVMLLLLVLPWGLERLFVHWRTEGYASSGVSGDAGEMPDNANKA